MAVAALLVIGVLIPSMLQGDDSAMKFDSAANSKIQQSDSSDNPAAGEELAKTSIVEEKTESSSPMMADEAGSTHHFAVYS